MDEYGLRYGIYFCISGNYMYVHMLVQKLSFQWTTHFPGHVKRYLTINTKGHRDGRI